MKAGIVDEKNEEGEARTSSTNGKEPPSMPTWVKIFGAIAGILVVAFVLLHLAGKGLHGH